LSLESVLTAYHWQGMLVHLLGLIILTKIAWKIAFAIPAVQKMRAWNKEEDKPKKALAKYRPVRKQTQQVGLYMHLLFFLLLVPFVVTLESQSIALILLNALLIILVFDFLYYLTHRFIFHGKLLKKVHGLHHQARDISYIDSQYVHPLETVIGTSLFMGSAIGLAWAFGEFHAVSFILAQFIFNNVNQINHTKFNLDYFPFKSIDYLTTKHQTHHIDMHHGNFSTLSPLYDWMFGTLD
jgi:sterol desaturase/sphingolipid hydroxylase (fatty acid hydroxylase superfamily)